MKDANSTAASRRRADMDYKELIERLEYQAASIRDRNIFRDAATAIETLLAEREAAVKDIERCCATCKHFLIFHNGCTPDYDCDNPECKNISGVNAGWQWRGPQKGGAE